MFGLEGAVDGLFTQVDALIFMAIALSALLLLLGSLVFGEVIEVLDFDPDGAFNLQSVAAFVAGFGATAWFMSGYLGTHPLVSAGVGVLAGVPVALLVVLLAKGLQKQEASSGFSIESIIGLEGIITLTITGRGPGRVQYTKSGSTQQDLAYSMNGEVLEEGSLVRIVDVAASGVFVERIKRTAEST